MKDRIGKIISQVLFISSFIGIICFVVGYIIRVGYDNNIQIYEEKLASENSEIAFVNVLQDEGSWGIELRLFIMFSDFNWIVVGNVREDENAIRIEGCNGKVFFIYKNIMEGQQIYKAHTSLLYAQELGDILNINLNNLEDIIQNYKIICNFFNEIDDIENEKYEDIDIYSDWVWNNSIGLNIWQISENKKYIVFKQKMSPSVLRDWF